MPAIALVGAAASVSAGLGAIAAAGGMAAMSFGAALAAGASIAGGIMTGLGAVTGNKKLLKIGAIVGLAGGIGTAMSGASSAASSGLGQAVDATGGLETATSFGANELAAATTGSGPLDFGGSFTSPVQPSSGIIGQQIAPPGSAESYFGEVPMAEAGQVADPTAATQLPSAQAATQQVAAAAQQGGIQSASITGAATPQANNALGGYLDKLKGAGKGALDYVTNPKNAQIVKVGGGLVQGAMGSYQKQAEYEQALAQREADRQRYNRSILGSYINR